MALAADARTGAGLRLPTDPVGTIPRAYNFAADILQQNLATGRASRPAFIDPRWIEFSRKLPKSATGKIQRFKLRAKGPAR